MIRLSFRQSMLAGFLLIASLLSWAAVRSWLVLEQFVDASRLSGEHVLQLSGSIQELADRTVDLERSARQFVVLNEATLIARFDTHLAHALAAVGRLESIPGEALGTLTGDWRAAAEELSAGLHRAAPAGELLPLLKRLAEINGELAHAGRQWIDLQNAMLLAQLEESRLQLAGLVAVTDRKSVV